MNIFKRLQFVREEIAEIPDIDEKPSGGVTTFLKRVTYALSLGFKEKEIFFFGLLQWVSIALAYLLWVQMLDWIPESVWESAANSNEASLVDLILWLFLCGRCFVPCGDFYWMHGRCSLSPQTRARIDRRYMPEICSTSELATVVISLDRRMDHYDSEC